MTNKKHISEILSDKIMVLDGATGTELQKKGMPAGVCPEIWAIENREIQKSIYTSYADAGSDIIYTCTFGANQLKLQQYGRDDVEKINQMLAQMAKEAAGSNTLVAGDIGPCGHFISPFGDIDFEDAVKMFKRQVRGLLDGGADLFVIETQMDIQEARAALIAVKELTDAFTIVSMTYEPDGRTLNGTSPEAALVTLQSLGADAAGCNCSSGPQEMLSLVKRLKEITRVPIVAKPNAGMPRIENGKTVFPMGSAAFASFASSFAEAGVNMMGGCCGTTPLHIKLLADKIAKYKPKPAKENNLVMLSSASEALVSGRGRALHVIGERINPTGKKKLQGELLEGKLSIIRDMAASQQESGAELLDINAGMPGIDEKETVIKIINMLSPVCRLPLVIDSSSPEVIEAALRIYPGRALINSISAEKTKMERLLPVAAKYGAMFILLPIADNELPSSFERRGEIAESVYNKAKKLGFTKNDIIVDSLVMTVSSNPDAAVQTLKTIKWASENSFSSVIGLSNVSFGLPERIKVNSSFLSMAVSSGLTHVIANPEENAIMWAKHASDLLTGKDRDAASFLNFASSHSRNPASTAGAERKISSSSSASNTGSNRSSSGTDSDASSDAIRNGIVAGIREDIAAHIKKGLDEGIAPSEILEKRMIPAILHVGELYDSKKYFLPQLIASAETMKKGFELLEPLLGEGGRKSCGKVLFATVEGDIHDIGKNIVVLMMRNYGFEVMDLGKDVPADKIIKAAKEFKPDIIALSALMTTTMVKMPEIIAMAEAENINVPFMAGGAVVTRQWADSIGAHYSKDGVEAVRVASSLF
ncbi:MAG: homocysteine S-methyltransferase family protein [Spirochaetia bacterium]|nr:homocysteine S-methyltransferase family protein [Spirochaetia bacterium]